MTEYFTLSDINPDTAELVDGFIRNKNGDVVYEFESIEVVDGKWKVTLSAVSDSPTD